MNAERITIEVDDHVADVRLVRSDKHNALDWEMITSLGEATDELTATPGLRAVVLSGEGPSFCSGLDFPSFIERGAPIEEIFTRAAHTTSDFPLIMSGAINRFFGRPN